MLDSAAPPLLPAVLLVAPDERITDVADVRVVAGWDGAASLVVDLRLACGDSCAGVRVVVRPHGSAPGGPVERLLAPASDGRVAAAFEVPGAAPWQPVVAGRGTPHRYRVDVELLDARRRVVARAVRLVAFRDVVVAPLAGPGTPSALHVNGRPVPVLPVAVVGDPPDLRRRLCVAAEAGATLVRLTRPAPSQLARARDLCDELGLLLRPDPPGPAGSASVGAAPARRHASWRALRDTLGPFGACLAGPDADLRLIVSDLEGDGRAATVLVRALRSDGVLVARHPVDVVVPPGARFVLPLAGVLDRSALLDADVVVADCGPDRATRWLSPRGTSPARGLTVTVRRPQHAVGGPERVEVEVATDAPVRDLCLLADLAVPEAVVDWQLLTVLPGEPVTFTVTGPGVHEVAPERWADLLYDDHRIDGPGATMVR